MAATNPHRSPRSPRYPRYVTFRDGELEKALEGMGASPAAAASLRAAAAAGHRPAVLDRHTCPVTYPDGTTGICSYTRCAATWRVFRYEHLGTDGKATYLPSQRTSGPMPDTVAAVVAAAERLASAAFQEAVQNERDFFGRATTLSGARPVEKPQMKAKRAAQLGGRYALCQPLGPDQLNLLPVSETFDSLDAANAAWEAQDNRRLVVACCCRSRRRWERPRYNPLHARPDYPAPTPALAPAPSPIREAAGDGGGDNDGDDGDDDAPMPGSDFAPESEEDE